MVREDDEDSWLTAAAEAAFQQAAMKVIERAKQAGTPVVIWQDDHIEEVPSDKLLPNVWANALAIEHRAWLRKFDSQYLSQWENLLNAEREAALVEAGVRRLLQHQGVTVEPNEGLTGNCGGPDFRCMAGGYRFYVEATCIRIPTAERKTGINDLATDVLPYNAMGMAEAIQVKCKDKASQCKGLDGPALVAIGTLHAIAATYFSEKRFVNLVLTGKNAMAWCIDATGQQVGETSNVTELEAAAFLGRDATREPEFERLPISGLLLWRISGEPQAALGVLNPESVRPFDPAFLPGVEFGRLELDRASRRMTVRWPKGGKC